MMSNKRSRSMHASMPGRTRYNAYKEALLNPVSGPLVGIPTSVPVDTHRARLKATTTITVTGGKMTILANPVFGLCSDALPTTPGGAGLAGVLNWSTNDFFGSAEFGTTILSNSQYARAQFAGLTTLSSVRGRVVAACLRICNVSAANTRNGVFTMFTDPQHNTLQSKAPSDVATDPKAQQFNASSPDWHTMTYHPVEPDEADSWVWDPARGPQGGVKTGAYISGSAEDRGAGDSFPGYMGIWWKGDAVSQTFQVEMYIIAEYVGQLVQPLVRDIGVDIEDAQDAREAAENAPTHVTSATDGASHSGHPHSDTHPSRAQRLLDFGKEHAGALKTAGKMAAVGVGGLLGGPAGAQTVAELLYTEGQISKAQKTADRYNELSGMRTPGRLTSGGRIPTPRITGSSYTTPVSYQSPASVSRGQYLASRGRGSRGRR